MSARDVVNRLLETDDEVDPKEFAMTQLYDQPGHGDDIVDREGRTIRRSHNMAGIRRYAGRNVVEYVNIWPLNRSPHPPGGLEIRFRDGSSYRTRFESYDHLKWTLMKWRNLYGAPLQVGGVESGKVEYRNLALTT